MTSYLSARDCGIEARDRRLREFGLRHCKQHPVLLELADCPSGSVDPSLTQPSQAPRFSRRKPKGLLRSLDEILLALAVARRPLPRHPPQPFEVTEVAQGSVDLFGGFGKLQALSRNGHP